MKLTYRGINYNIAPAFPTVNSGITATYRGLTYSLPQSNAVAVMSTKTLMYRGIVIGGAEVTDQQVLNPAMA